MLKAMSARKTKNKRSHKGLRHHARQVYYLTPRFVHGMVIGAFVGIVLVMSLGPVFQASALTINSARDCDTNAVIRCGALTTSELKKAYERWGSVRHIYSYFGISSGDIKDVDKYVVAGRVYKNGEVRIGKDLRRVVATSAVTAGRENIKGSKRVVHQGTTFYTRAPKVSFRVSSIAAFVVMRNNKFDFAILAACGNPVKATAKVTAVPTPPPAPEPEPEPKPEPKVVIRTASTQTPPSKPTPIVVETEAKALPVTGPGEVGLVAFLSVIGGYLYHVTHRHIKHKRRLRQMGHA
jgi:hypothetical protein